VHHAVLHTERINTPKKIKRVVANGVVAINIKA
jgi:hypothetical protein